MVGRPLLPLLLSLSVAVAEPGEPSASPSLAAHQLPHGEGLYVRWDPDRSWGSAALVEALTDVAERVAFLLPHADPLLVGDISRRGGGRLFGHKTHHLGVDVDIGLYLEGGRQPLGGFFDAHPDQLDLHATWVLVRALVNSGRVAFILLDQRHIDALRAHVLHELDLPPEVVDPILPPPDPTLPWDQRGVVRHAPNHASHLHVRFTHASDS